MTNKDIGSYRDRAEILEVTQTGKDYVWTVCGQSWCRVDPTGKPSIFARVGLAAEGWLVTMRDRPLTLHNALRIHGKHFFLVQLDRRERGFLEAQAVTVPVVTVAANMNQPENDRFRFPACFTELYVKHEQLEPMSVNPIEYVLVTPKAVMLEAGCLVEVNGELYEHLTDHTLDEAKNEYVIGRSREK